MRNFRCTSSDTLTYTCNYLHIVTYRSISVDDFDLYLDVKKHIYIYHMIYIIYDRYIYDIYIYMIYIYIHMIYMIYMIYIYDIYGEHYIKDINDIHGKYDILFMIYNMYMI
jgi:hypothetical protein